MSCTGAGRARAAAASTQGGARGQGGVELPVPRSAYQPAAALLHCGPVASSCCAQSQDRQRSHLQVHLLEVAPRAPRTDAHANTVKKSSRWAACPMCTPQVIRPERGMGVPLRGASRCWLVGTACGPRRRSRA